MREPRTVVDDDGTDGAGRSASARSARQASWWQREENDAREARKRQRKTKQTATGLLSTISGGCRVLFSRLATCLLMIRTPDQDLRASSCTGDPVVSSLPLEPAAAWDLALHNSIARGKKKRGRRPEGKTRDQNIMERLRRANIMEGS
jgi:hypothetical protein